MPLFHFNFGHGPVVAPYDGYWEPNGTIDELRISDVARCVAEIGNPAPVLSCNGFDPPMTAHPVTVKKNRALPLKAQVFDADGYALTNIDLLAPPVIQALYDSGLGGRSR